MLHIKTLLLTLALCYPLLTQAQTTKEITVSQNNPYTDHLSLKDDSKDMDLMAKFVFNESANTLSVYLISYRDLFVFQTDTPCKQAVKWKRRLKPEKLPFVVNTEPGAKYHFAYDYWKTLPKPRRKHVFEKWVEYSGLAPVPAEYKMVNDFVQQDFNILNNADAVTLSLHDVMMIDQEAVSKPTLKKRYDIVWGKDLNITYHIYIQRNPCFGMEKDSTAAAKALESIKAGYKNLADRFGSGIVSDRESLANFKEMKKLLTGQFPVKTDKSPCSIVQAQWDAYNQYADSISNMTCRIRTQVVTSTGGTGGSGSGVPTVGLNAGYILTQARRIDDAVARWLVSKDRAERSDLQKRCEEIIKMMKGATRQRGATASQANALRVFNEAVKYYNTICK